MRDEIKATITEVAQANGLEIEFVGKKTGRKEERIQAILSKRGQQPGVVHIFAAIEGCQTYKPWYDQASGKSYLKTAESKCLTAANQRNLKFIAALDTPEVAQQRLQQLTETKTEHQHRYKGFLLKRLRVHGLLKKVGQHYKYHLTNLGRQVATMALKLRELVVIPTLAQDSSLSA